MRNPNTLLLRGIPMAVLVLAVASAVTLAANHQDGAPQETGTAESLEIPSDFLDTMKSVMTGTWVGQYTNGTFEEPGEWKPVRVEYRRTSRGTALVEDYYFRGEPDPGMTTVYHKDNNELRLTHYCGASNHPQMLARDIDPKLRLARFDFTGITNLSAPDKYHSRQLELTLLTDDHIRIQYHGLMQGEVRSQAYDLKRAP